MGRHWVHTSESVTEGHPDKMADQISDAILDAILTDDPMGRVACETFVTTGLAIVGGEISTSTYIDVPKLVREVIMDIGYTRAKYGFDGETCGVLIAIQDQSPNIAVGVETAREIRTGTKQDEIDEQGAGDQGMMVGYACTDTDDLMPAPIQLAHRLSRRLAAVRKSGDISYLRPDGKTQVTIEYDGNKPVRVANVVVSAQHQPEIDIETLLEPDVREQVVEPILAESALDYDGFDLMVNPTGIFEIGGPKADTGLTGRKIIVDTYGGMAPHGGGAFSGKDPTKVDRSAAYAARWVAKNVVGAGFAERCQLQLAYAIGVARPVSISVETFGTENIAVEKIEKAIGEVFDLRPAAILRDLDLRRPIYRQTAAYGHFGRKEKDFTWERLDRIDDLKSAV